MRHPENKEELKTLMASLLDSYGQEMEEIKEYAPNVEDIYFSDHLGSWIVTYKDKRLRDDEFETKEQALEFIKSESSQP